MGDALITCASGCADQPTPTTQPNGTLLIEGIWDGPSITFQTRFHMTPSDRCVIRITSLKRGSGSGSGGSSGGGAAASAAGGGGGGGGGEEFKVLGVITLGVGQPQDTGVAETYDLCAGPARPRWSLSLVFVPAFRFCLCPLARCA